jgi:hypothetical protein
MMDIKNGRLYKDAGHTRLPTFAGLSFLGEMCGCKDIVSPAVKLHFMVCVGRLIGSFIVLAHIIGKGGGKEMGICISEVTAGSAVFSF